MERIDLNTWKRRPHYEFFLGFEKPFFDVAARIDVSPLVELTRRSELRLFPTLLHTVCLAANDTDALRLRLIPEGVARVSRIAPSFTVMSDQGTFNYATAPLLDDLHQFNRTLQTHADRTRNLPELFLSDDDRLELIYVTSMPWLDFQSISHPFPGDRLDSAPRIAWGKVVPTPAGGFEATLQLTSHHALADGRDAAEFFEHLNRRLRALASLPHSPA
ncbi:CatA-like O-acetyltransferase [Lujinxingia litoralis]|uniref:CatA-like O-acetyltransferase n=1 Tax=Lujinxingia litoralis TaxID=2211119 RepID=UPI00131421BC|nr:CatA-like O-acetyltransferase [Lujinxingia litoralis]